MQADAPVPPLTLNLSPLMSDCMLLILINDAAVINFIEILPPPPDPPIIAAAVGLAVGTALGENEGETVEVGETEGDKVGFTRNGNIDGFGAVVGEGTGAFEGVGVPR